MLPIHARRFVAATMLFAMLGCPDSKPAPTAPLDDTFGLSPATSDINVGGSVTLQCRSTTSRSPVSCADWTSSDNNTLRFALSPSGSEASFAGLKDGTATVAARSVSGRTASATVRVHAYSVSVTPASADLMPQQTASLAASIRDFRGTAVSPSTAQLEFVWSASPSTAVAVASSGTGNAAATVTAIQTGQTVVTAKLKSVFASGGTPLEYGQGTATINVSPSPLTVTTDLPTYTMATGSSVLILVTTRDAAGNVISSPTLAFSSNPGYTVLTSSPTSVVVRGLAPGSYQFTITATANGIAGSRTVTLLVT